MRSDLVFRANDKVQNRFQLCRLTSTSARTMTRSSVGMHLVINEALEAIIGHSKPILMKRPQAEKAEIAESLNPADLILDAAV